MLTTDGENIKLGPFYTCRVYKCEQCPRQLTTSKGLKKHLLTHQRKGQHVCPHCEKRFKTKCGLQGHIKNACIKGQHGKIKCPVCLKSIKTKQGVEKHINSAHHNVFETDFGCELCSMRFATIPLKKQHISDVHIENLDYKLYESSFRGRAVIFRKYFHEDAENMHLLLKEEEQEEMVSTVYAYLLKHPHQKYNLCAHLLLAKFDDEGQIAGKRDHMLPSRTKRVWLDKDLVKRQIREATQEITDRLDDIEEEGSGWVFVAYVKNDISISVWNAIP